MKIERFDSPHPDPNKTIAHWIESSAYSLRKIENGTGISRSRLSKIGRGTATLTVPELVVLSSFLERNPRSLFRSGQALEAVDGRYKLIGNRIAEAVMDGVARRSVQQGVRLSVEDVARWHGETDGRLHLAPTVASHLVAFSPIEHIHDQMRVVGVGQHSLSSRKLRFSTTDCVGPLDVESFVTRSIAPEARDELMKGYVAVQASRERQYFDRCLVYRTGRDRGTCTTYLTLLMHGTWEDGEPVIWNFSSEISSRSASYEELAAIPTDLGHQ